MALFEPLLDNRAQAVLQHVRPHLGRDREKLEDDLPVGRVLRLDTGVVGHSHASLPDDVREGVAPDVGDIHGAQPKDLAEHDDVNSRAGGDAASTIQNFLQVRLREQREHLQQAQPRAHGRSLEVLGRDVVEGLGRRRQGVDGDDDFDVQAQHCKAALQRRDADVSRAQQGSEGVHSAVGALSPDHCQAHRGAVRIGQQQTKRVP
mmetsp:Transcript_4021/g.15523  ORF Transcript_4021/g.15523 Transcript_4021/m.15523 type:complete len:205 (+) Transcript_4021:750-1364(+)